MESLAQVTSQPGLSQKLVGVRVPGVNKAGLQPAVTSVLVSEHPASPPCSPSGPEGAVGHQGMIKMQRK